MKTKLARATAIVATLFATATASFADDPTKVAFVYISPANDGGWSEAHDRGRMALEAHFGDDVEVTVVESIPENADSERVFSRLAQDGNDVIFATSFGYMDPVIKTAQRFPDTVFINATGYKTADNVGTYTSRYYEGAYLQGILAGYMSESEILGYVASFPIPTAYLTLNAYTLGARSVNPDITTKVIWVNTWYDPARERQAAETLLSQGADVLAQITDSPAALIAAAEVGSYAFGWDTDMSEFAPEAHLTASTTDWGPYYIEQVSQVRDGTWVSAQTVGGAGVGWLEMSPLNDAVTPEAAAAYAEALEGLQNGTLQPFTGPIVDHTGTVRAEAGQALTDGELFQMNYYVEGVEGTPPQ